MKNNEQIIQHKTDEKFNVNISTVLSRHELHWHEFFEVELYTEGNGVHYINGKEVRSNGGFLTLLTPWDFHLFNAELGTRFHIKKFVFYEDYICADLLKILKNKSPCIIHLCAEQVDYFSRCIDEMYALNNLNDEISKLILRNNVEKACIDIIKLCPENNRSEDIYSRQYDKIIQNIINYIEKHYLEKITLEDVSNEVHMNPAYVSRFFTKTFGIPFSKHLKMMRIKHASHLLKHSDMTIQDISIASGFNSVTFFNRAFMQEKGVTPKEYRKSVQ